jgi:hypothetical protein
LETATKDRCFLCGPFRDVILNNKEYQQSKDREYLCTASFHDVFLRDMNTYKRGIDTILTAQRSPIAKSPQSTIYPVPLFLAAGQQTPRTPSEEQSGHATKRLILL